MFCCIFFDLTSFSAYKNNVTVKLSITCYRPHLQVVKGWQDYILAHNLKQPFEQMWEPVFDFTKNHEFSELIGTTLSASERNEMKKSLKDKGIEVYSDQNEVTYDYYQMKYVFSNRNRMHFGNYIDAEYTINDDKSIKFETFRVKDYRKKRAVNTIVLTLLKAVVKSIIISDSAEKLSRDYLRLFTVAQIISFISAANDDSPRSIDCSSPMQKKTSSLTAISAPDAGMPKPNWKRY